MEYDEASDTTKYTAKLREDLVFSDGEPVSADDLIFTYYTFLDPSYSGSTTLGSYPIIGLKDYQTQTTSDVFDSYDVMANAIFAAGPEHEWTDADSWTQEQQDDFWARLTAEWKADVQSIVDFVNTNYADYAPDYIGKTPAEVAESEDLQIVFGMALWQYGELNEDGEFVAAVSGTTWNLVDSFPTIDDYYAETYALYEGDPVTYASKESPNGVDVFGNAVSAFIGYWGPMDDAMGGTGVPSIAGIVKVDDYTVEITLEGFSAPAVYSVLGVDITPMHYYGDPAKYDYCKQYVRL